MTHITTDIYSFDFKGQERRGNSIVPVVILDKTTGEPLGDYYAWGFIPDTTKDIIYFTGVEGSNPSGNKNIKEIIFYKGGDIVFSQLFQYDIDDDIISITGI